MQRNKSDMNYTDKMLRDDALKGKVIVVTGGGSGLGKAMTQYFLELGKSSHYSRDLDKLKIPHQNWKRNRRYVFAYTM
jgi:NADP-dependent 3-hydroxy acid dehydrogenase YdfG